MPILFVSEDNGQLYEQSDLDNPDDPNPDGFWKIQVPDTFTLTAKQVCGGDGAIAEILFRSGVATKV